MSRRTIVDCDGCGLPDIKGEPITIAVGYQVDTATARTEAREESFGLCDVCAARAFRLTAPEIPAEWGEKLAAAIKSWKSKFYHRNRP